MERQMEVSTGTCDWQLQKGKLTERGKYLLETGLWSDCMFIVGIETNQREFRAHKLILSMSSPVFDAMFHNSFQEKKNTVIISDVQPEAFATLLMYIYTDKVTFHSFDQACELCYVANKYMMPFLAKQCTAYIWKDLNHTNVCRAYEFSKLFDQSELMDKCKEIICEETMKVLQCPSFLEAEETTLSMILDQDVLNINKELELFTSTVSWINAEISRRGISDEGEKWLLADPLLRKIRYLTMTGKEFAEGPGMSRLIPPSTGYALLLAVSSSVVINDEMWPNGWERSSTPRGPKLITVNLASTASNSVFGSKTVTTTETPFVFCATKDVDLHAIQVSEKLNLSFSSFNPGFNIIWIDDTLRGARLATAPINPRDRSVPMKVELKSNREYKIGISSQPQVSFGSLSLGGKPPMTSYAAGDFFIKTPHQPSNPTFVSALVLTPRS